MDTPRKHSFYFGLNICAFCLDYHQIPKRERRKSYVWPEQRGWDNEVMIPAGYQAFHKTCFEKMQSEPAAPTESKNQNAELPGGVND